MFQICFCLNPSQDLVFEISKIIQNFDHKYISGHVLACAQNRHLNYNSTHCAPPPLRRYSLWTAPKSTLCQVHKLILIKVPQIIKSFVASKLILHKAEVFPVVFFSMNYEGL